MDVSWASISRKAISQEPLGVCAAGGSCRLDSAQVLMVPGLPDQEGTKCGNRQNRLRGTEQEQKAGLGVKGGTGEADVCTSLLGTLQDAAAPCPLFPLPDSLERRERGLISAKETANPTVWLCGLPGMKFILTQ